MDESNNEDSDGRGRRMRSTLQKWLNKNMKIEITDGRTLIGTFLCTDKDRNVILGMCSEYLNVNGEVSEEPRKLGLALVPGRHIVTIHIDDNTSSSEIM